MEVLFISGVSGAGKSTTMNVLEDLDYYCVDNLPLQLIPTFLQLIENAGYQKVAIATDARGINSPEKFVNSDEMLDAKQVEHKVIFMECNDAGLIKRYKLSRRRHPFMDKTDKNISHAIERERKVLTPIRERADYVIDTSFLKPAQLKNRLLDILSEDNSEGMRIYSMSFGFKHGTPSEADLMFDVRCLPNPYYVRELREKTGLEEDVQAYVMNSENSEKMFAQIAALTKFLIPLYEAEGKSQLVIAFGCSGGRHRSVTFAEKLAGYLQNEGFAPIISHRDIDKV